LMSKACAKSCTAAHAWFKRVKRRDWQGLQ
jgi:hypothetical protein